MSILAEHLAATRQTFIERTGKEPRTLALGRWDVRELVRVAAPMVQFTLEGERIAPMKPAALLRQMRSGATAWGAEVKVDGRIGRMPSALWWHE